MLIRPITPDDNSLQTSYQNSAVGKTVENLTGFLTDLQDLSQVENLPEPLQNLLNLGTQLNSLLGTTNITNSPDLIPLMVALRTANSSLESLTHHIKDSLKKNNISDFTNGPLSTAWTSSLIGKATTEITGIINLLQK